ncbi:protein serine/threonine phosphatase 2C [Aspergillus heteromorphus CBS 117.55]|uniref:Protein serine/threonine phosphatase 2C n=1 Tax=Aspergillus heteromorphus CBS 117.55 TaxID=1448321 RepID=A0A317VN78_9EURO|nr:protein serine/threonine phosphatase 2C [Aspergillus heteromorphus CBS 117.55]PWY74388.1 protein serine/threonine phosphatase 2C [Aspergillus heteromorphus CBS 117.55]
MLSRGIIGARTRLGRVPRSIVRTYATNIWTRRGQPSKFMRNVAIAGCVGIPSIWWMTTRDRKNDEDVLPPDNVPRLDSPPTERLVFEPGPGRGEVTRMLSENACSFGVQDVPGVVRYDLTQVASNSQCEDRFVHGKIPSPWGDGNQWMAWGVFDGHAGWQTAELLKNQLVPFVRHSLGQVELCEKEKPAPVEVVQSAIVDGFVNFDNCLVRSALGIFESDSSLQDKMKRLAPAWAGSCALLSLYDPATSILHVACTGDSRAIFGHKGPDGNLEVIPLSIDQTGHNEDEVARLSREHPGEENIVKDGRVLGLAVSRAFGDSQWKWPPKFLKDVSRAFYGLPPLTPRYEVLTPPYLTAEPVVTSIKIDPTNASFVIMATDGLWDMMTNQQCVDLVAKWLEEQYTDPEPTYDSFNFSRFWTDTPWKYDESRTTVEDDNVAVHLVRNAWGGNHHELLAGRLASSPPFSRRVRDDVTVQDGQEDKGDLSRE